MNLNGPPSPIFTSCHSCLTQPPTFPHLNWKLLPMAYEAKHALASATTFCHSSSCYLYFALCLLAALSLFTILKTHWFPSAWKVLPVDLPLAGSFLSFRSQHKYKSPHQALTPSLLEPVLSDIIRYALCYNHFCTRRSMG